MSSEKFENLEDDFVQLRDEINRKVHEILPKVTGESRKALLLEIERSLDDAHLLHQEMENEVRSAPNPFRMQMNIRVKQYRQELEKLNKTASKAGQSLSDVRHELFGNNLKAAPSVYNPNVLDNQRACALQITGTIERTSQSIAKAQQIAAEVDGIGVSVVDELGAQRETLIHTKERLVDTDANISKSKKILRSMYRRVATNKLILVIIILLELGILGGVVYLKFFNK